MALDNESVFLLCVGMYEAMDVKMIQRKTRSYLHICTFIENEREIERGTKKKVVQ